MTGENIRNRLPVLSRDEWICDQKEQAPGRNVTSEFNNKAARDLPELKKGDTVHCRVSENNWARKGVIKSKEITPRSYIFKSEDGKVIRRNRRDLLPTQENFAESLDELHLDDDLQESHDSHDKGKKEEDPTKSVLHDSTDVREIQDESLSATTIDQSTETNSESASVKTNTRILSPSTSSLKSNSATTRSGRVTKRPKWLKDYE